MFFIILLFDLNLLQSYALFLQQPELINVAKFKPIYLNPIDSVCGINFQETIYDNLIVNSTTLIYCDQICPHGKSYSNISSISEQLDLYSMQPCDIKKDYDFILNSKSNTLFSYYFDISNNINKCVNDGTKIDWKPFNFSTNIANKKSKTIHNGFSFTLWFQQFIKNIGFAIILYFFNLNYIT